LRKDRWSLWFGSAFRAYGPRSNNVPAGELVTGA
jgi:hypothetical protein